MKKSKFIGPLYCISAAVIWGLSFVAQKQGAHIGTFTFNGIRLIIGGIALLPVLAFNRVRAGKKVQTDEKTKSDIKGVIIGSICCGTALVLGSNLQQHAFSFDIPAGKVGFITALYMILVPVLGLFLKKIPKINVWISCAIGIVGLYFLCLPGGGRFTIGKGETFALICAFCFAAHILIVDHFCTKVDGIALSCFQYLFAGIISVICMFIFEGKPAMSDLIDSAVPLLYAGIGSCSLAFTFQIYGQRYTEPAVASILLCLESVFSVIFGWLIINDVLNKRSIIGCCIMFAGVILSQIEFKSKKESDVTANAD